MTIDFRSETFCDLTSVTRKQYYDFRKSAAVSAQDCFITGNNGLQYLWVKDGENFYCGLLLEQVDTTKFDGIKVVRTKDIYRIYMEKLPQLEQAEDTPVSEEQSEPEKAA